MRTPRRLILVRHAKSAWDDPALADHDRPLNGRGRRDAPAMAARLASRAWPIAALISSTAVRARSTAEVFHRALPETLLVLDRACYHAAPSALLERIHTWSPAWPTVALFGHNPGLSALLDLLCGTTGSDLPTAAVAMLELSCTEWSTLAPGQARLLALDAPKAPLPDGPWPAPMARDH